MRRQTTKQPRGPAASATPRPPIRARQKKSSRMASMMGMVTLRVSAMPGSGVVGIAVHHIPVQVVTVVMVMVVDCQGLCHRPAKCLDESRVMGDVRRETAAADMLVKADNFVRGCHNQMQVVGDHDHAAIQVV